MIILHLHEDIKLCEALLVDDYALRVFHDKARLSFIRSGCQVGAAVLSLERLVVEILLASQHNLVKICVPLLLVVRLQEVADELRVVLGLSKTLF